MRRQHTQGDYVPGGAGTGRQPAPMNAPIAQPLGIGVQPGTPNIIKAFQVIVFGPNAGVFVYSPTIGAGNLVASITASPGTDPYGNFYPAGLNVGKISSGHTHINTDGSIDINNSSSQLVATFRPQDEALLIYNPPGAAGSLVASIAAAAGTDQFGNVYSGPGMTSYAGNGATDLTTFLTAGILEFPTNTPASNIPQIATNSAGTQLLLKSGSTGPIPAWFRMQSSALAPTIAETPVVPWDPTATTHTTAESWHNFGSLSNGWSKNGGSVYHYRKLSSGLVAVEMQNINVGTTANGTVIVTGGNGLNADASYLPDAPLWIPVRCDSPGGQTAAFSVQTSGDIQCFGIGAAATRVDANFVFFGGL